MHKKPEQKFIYKSRHFNLEQLIRSCEITLNGCWTTSLKKSLGPTLLKAKLNRPCMTEGLFSLPSRRKSPKPNEPDRRRKWTSGALPIMHRRFIIACTAAHQAQTLRLKKENFVSKDCLAKSNFIKLTSFRVAATVAVLFSWTSIFNQRADIFLSISRFSCLIFNYFQSINKQGNWLWW